MILSSINDAQRYYSLHPQLKRLFEYIKENDLAHAPKGRIELCGEDLFINIAEVEMVSPEAQKLEVHRAYLDVHIPFSETERIGWRHLQDIDVAPEAAFNETDDFALYNTTASTYVDVKPGEFLIVFPEDAHAPIIGRGNLKKIIAKIKL